MRSSVLRRICALSVAHARPSASHQTGTQALHRATVDFQQGYHSLLASHRTGGNRCLAWFSSAPAEKSRDDDDQEKPEQAQASKDDISENSSEEEEQNAKKATENGEDSPESAANDADAQEDADEPIQTLKAEPVSESASGVGAEEASSEGESVSEALTAEIKRRGVVMAELQKKNDELKDKVLRTLAEMENMRDRVLRQAEQSKKFALSGFVKDLFDVADNLERALDSVPLDKANDPGGEENAKKLLLGLLEGVKLTDQQLIQVFKKNGVQKFSPENETFDPNKHSAMFEMPGTSENSGTVGAVMKCGYLMHDRVVRAAEVGIYKAPPEEETPATAESDSK
ncbi:hypothetical protein BSKO_06971 [Bryopsis sp. KO-2023]|nr:hypothetical protein BSKO_06971 [Bryopsis sp. KO-2023]